MSLLPDEVRQRAVTGALALAIRGALVRVAQLSGNLVLARLLQPTDFGILAVGLTLLAFSEFLVTAGLGLGLIRLNREPDRNELAAVLGFQLIMAMAVLAIVSVVATGFGKAGAVTAIMAISLPVLAMQTPAMVITERALTYNPIVFSEVGEAVTYSVLAITFVLIGWGVYGVAAAVVIRSLVGSVTLIALVPQRVLRPRFHWSKVRGLLRFAGLVQAGEFVGLGRDQVLNLGTAAIAGYATLGIWSVAYRILQVPFFIFESLWRVSFPAMSQLRSAGEDLSPLLRRVASITAVMVDGILVLLAAGGPALVVVLLGEKWHLVEDVIPWACLGLAVNGPMSVVSSGYLYAVGDAAAVLKAITISSLAWIAVGLALVTPLGAEGIGIGWMVGSLLEAGLFTRAVRRHANINLLGSVLPPTLLAAVAGGGGLAVSRMIGDGVGAALAGASVAELLFLLSLFFVRHDALVEAFRLGARALGRVGTQAAPAVH
jgi:O-antigen/teichoic acid export membrane protein